jgi:hypothetical protein
MKRNADIQSDGQSEQQSTVQSPTTYGELPNRLLTAFEVAEFIGCHEEANDFAIPRMEPGKQRPIQSMEEARDWERRFIGEIKAGRDPHRGPNRSIHVSTELNNVCSFLDAYLERCVKPAELKSINSVRSRIAVLEEHLGDLPLSALEAPDDINRFKTDSDYADDVELATLHRTLETLRAAINWGMAQTPPLFTKSPFHRFGVRLNKKAETSRDRRLSRDEEKRLLDTALARMNTPEHQFVGPVLHDRIIERYLNVTDEELRRGLEVSWKNRGRPLRLASGS